MAYVEPSLSKELYRQLLHMVRSHIFWYYPTSLPLNSSHPVLAVIRFLRPEGFHGLSKLGLAQEGSFGVVSQSAGLQRVVICCWIFVVYWHKLPKVRQLDFGFASSTANLLYRRSARDSPFFWSNCHEFLIRQTQRIRRPCRGISAGGWRPEPRIDNNNRRSWFWPWFILRYLESLSDFKYAIIHISAIDKPIIRASQIRFHVEKI